MQHFRRGNPRWKNMIATPTIVRSRYRALNNCPQPLSSLIQTFVLSSLPRVWDKRVFSARISRSSIYVPKVHTICCEKYEWLGLPEQEGQILPPRAFVAGALQGSLGRRRCDPVAPEDEVNAEEKSIRWPE